MRRSEELSLESPVLPDVIKARAVFPLAGVELRNYRLVRLSADDLTRMFDLLHDSDEGNWQRRRPDSGYVETLLNFRIDHYGRFGFGVMGVEDSTGKLLGQAGLQVLNEADDSVEGVVFLGGDLTGQGLGSLIATEAISRAKRERMRHLYATIRDDNWGAQRLIKRFGFDSVGRANHFGYDSGVWRKQL